MTTTKDTTKDTSKAAIKTSEAGVPLGSDEGGSPLSPFPHDPPPLAIPADAGTDDHNYLQGQSGSPEKYEDDYEANAQKVAPDGPFNDTADDAKERREAALVASATPIIDVTKEAKAK